MSKQRDQESLSERGTEKKETEKKWNKEKIQFLPLIPKKKKKKEKKNWHSAIVEPIFPSCDVWYVWRMYEAPVALDIEKPRRRLPPVSQRCRRELNSSPGKCFSPRLLL